MKLTKMQLAAHKAWKTRRANQQKAKRRAAALKAWRTIRTKQVTLPWVKTK